jgi:DNA-binding transcriptional regulator YhcF (GntR family)
MRFWFEHSSDVSLREQVVAQVTLGILCGELAPGERLPSIRELARRFKIHANTVSAGYRQLEVEGWVASRKGSGVYVRATRPVVRDGSVNVLDRIVANLFDTTRRLGIADSEVTHRVAGFAVQPGFERILLVEPDPELGRIIVAELTEAVSLPIEIAGFGESAGQPTCTFVVTLPSKLDRVKTEFPGCRVHCLRIRSVLMSLAEHLPPPDSRAGMLVGVASRWPDFLRFARTMLVAAGFDADALIIRDPSQPSWREGLTQAAAVLCDVPTASQLAGVRTIVSRLLADGVADELNTLVRPPVS